MHADNHQHRLLHYLRICVKDVLRATYAVLCMWFIQIILYIFHVWVSAYTIPSVWLRVLFFT
jgi:hypothetical protein